MESNLLQTHTRNLRAQRRALWFVSILLGLVICAVVIISLMVLRTARSGLEQAMERDLNNQAQQRVAVLTVWYGTLQSQVKTISDADVLRLFATGVKDSGLSPQILLQQADKPEGRPRRLESEDANADDPKYVLARVPLMRKLLSNFVSRTNFLSAQLINPQGQPYLSTLQDALPLTEGAMKAVREVLEKKKTLMLPVRYSSKGSLILDVLQPVYPPRYMMEAGDKPLAVLLLTCDVTDIVRQMTVTLTDEREGESGRLLQRFGSNGLQEVLLSAEPRPLPGWLLSSQGHLPAQVRSLPDGTGVYSLALSVPGLPWLVEEDALLEKSLGAYRAYRFNVILAAVGCAVMAGLFLGMIWWWLLGRRERAVARELGQLYHTVNQQRQLLDGINDTLADGIILRDEQGRLEYVNNAFAAMLGKDPRELTGKLSGEVLSPELADRGFCHADVVGHTGKPRTFRETLPIKGEKRHFQVACSPFKNAEGQRGGVVSLYRDITDLVNAQERAQGMVYQTINVLVRSIEAVDPYLQGQSTRTGQLACFLAQRLGLNETHEFTLRTAANLSQIGMIQLPRTLVSKEGFLTTEERRQLEAHVEHARTALEGIDFGFPILPAICQMHEHMDGSGYPKHLKGDEITLDARVLSVANTFCALVRPRSYREARTVEQALEILSATPPKYDPEVVWALREFLQTLVGENFLKNRLGEGD